MDCKLLVVMCHKIGEVHMVGMRRCSEENAAGGEMNRSSLLIIKHLRYAHCFNGGPAFGDGHSSMNTSSGETVKDRGMGAIPLPSLLSRQSAAPAGTQEVFAYHKYDAK